MATKSTRVPTRYLKLIEAFPLRPIRSAADHDAAIQVAERLMRRQNLSDDEDDYLEVLTDLIEAYESEIYPSEDLSGPGMLRFLIEARRETQADVAKGTGIPESSLSEMISGKRKIAARHMTALGKHFNVDPGLFLEKAKREGPHASA